MIAITFARKEAGKKKLLIFNFQNINKKEGISLKRLNGNRKFV